MVAKAVASAVTAIAVIGAGIIVYQSSSHPKSISFNNNENTITTTTVFTPKNFALPSFAKASDFGAEEVSSIQKEVCGGIGKKEWVPQETVFAYLEPRETLFRIPCGQGPAGYVFRSFFITSAGPEIIDEYHPNSQSLFDIISPQQAAEYVMYFDIVRAGEIGNKQFVITADQYDKLSKQCIHNNNNAATAANFNASSSSSSTVKALIVISPLGSNDHIVELNFVNNGDGSFEYRQYRVTQNGTITLLTQRIIGNCNNVASGQTDG